jgi:20S proteasome alpha/beta subunit
MTIVIGMLCQGGVVVAADTQITWPDGTTYDATKIQSATIATGALAVGYTCLNANAAESLVRDLILDVTMVSPKSLFGLIAVQNSLIALAA